MVSSLTRWYCRESAWPCRIWRVLPTYRSVCAQISSYPQGFSTRTGLCSGILVNPSSRRHHHRRGAQLALHVAAETLGRLLVGESADAHTVPDAFARHPGLGHVRLEPGAGRARGEMGRVAPVLRGAQLDGEPSW